MDSKLVLINRIISCITDQRDQLYIDHQLPEMLRKRAFQIASSYAGSNDSAQLRSDSAFKLCARKLPETDGDLATQPTLSLFKNSIPAS
jgi:hypothetical protein